MRIQKVITTAAFFLTALVLPALVLLNCSTTIGQVLQPDQSLQQNASAPTGDRAGSQKSHRIASTLKENEPYRLSSRLHLQKGSNTGYLILKVELPKGSYIYSVSQKPPLRPSKIEVIKSNQFRLKGKFSPDRPATVIENDPIFKQRLEKHTDVIQFFAPVEVDPNVVPESLESEISFTGQVCSDQGICMPISAAKTRGKFAGYFKRSAK